MVKLRKNDVELKGDTIYKKEKKKKKKHTWRS